MEMEPVNQSKPDRPYLACSGCCGSHMPSGWSAWLCKVWSAQGHKQNESLWLTKGSSPFEGCFLSVSAFAVYLLVTRTTKTHKVGLVIWSFLGERNWNGRMGTQLSLSRFLPVKVKTAGISGRRRRQLSGIVNWNPWSSSTKRIWSRNTIFRRFDPAGSTCCPIHLKQAEKPSRIVKQGNPE